MKYLFIFTSLLAGFLGSCKRDPDTNVQKTKADAYLVNTLPGDGCYWHFSGIENDKYYAPNDASQRKIEELINIVYVEEAINVSYIPVSVEFSHTGSKKAVQCGWGRKTEMEEINIYNLKIREE